MKNNILSCENGILILLKKHTVAVGTVELCIRFLSISHTHASDRKQKSKKK